MLTGRVSVAGISTNTGHNGTSNDGEWAGPHNDVSTPPVDAKGPRLSSPRCTECHSRLGLARHALERARGQGGREAVLRDRSEQVVLSGLLQRSVPFPSIRPYPFIVADMCPRFASTVMQAVDKGTS